MVVKKLYKVLVFILSLIIISSGCKNNSNSPTATQTEKGSWAIRTPFDWTHDGDPYNSIFCTIYSDAASDDLKQHLGEIADESFSSIMQLFEFDDISNLRYPPGYSKIDIYINRNHSESVNWAYRGGFIFTIRSSEITGHWLGYTVYTVRHELMHVFEFLIEGEEDLLTEFWFKEGIAVNVGCLESTAFQKITTLNELESWVTENSSVSGQGNPVKIKQYEDYPPGADQHQYYRFFELAVRYLLDTNGLGRSYSDVLDLIYDLRDGMEFSVSFEDNFGISVNDYENEFYNRMRTYLDGGN